MGQSASKGLTNSVKNVARKVADAAQPTGPPVVPKRTPGVSPSAAPAPPSATMGQPTPANPGMFLRGEGIATQDIRDKGQELYLQNLHQLDDEAKTKGPADMPEDLLKFIQDVGPAKQAVDKDFTAPRLLEEQNADELQKSESSRKVMRERIKMPLMGADENFTTTRNTNFSRQAEEQVVKDFGLTNLQLYHLILGSRTKENETEMENLYQEVLKEEGTELLWTEEEMKKHRELLRHAQEAIEIPVLRRDQHGNFLGLHPENVPGPEVKSVEAVPETKIKLVLQDLADSKDDTAEPTSASARLEQRRKLRKAANQNTT